MKIMKKNGLGGHALLLLDYVTEQNGDVILTYDWEGTDGAFSDDELLTIINGSASSKQVDISQLPNAKRIIMTSGTEDENTGVAYWVDKKDSYDLNFVPAGAEITLASEYHSVTVKFSEECSLKLSSQDEGDSRVEVTSSAQNTVDVTFENFSKDGNTINNITINGSRSDGGTITLKSNNSRVDIQGVEKLTINETQQTEDENDDVTMNSDKELRADELDNSKNYQFKDVSAEEDSDRGLTDGSGNFDTIISVIQDKKIDISKCAAKLDQKEVFYTGNEIKPELVISYGAKVLKNGEDYKAAIMCVFVLSGRQKEKLIIPAGVEKRK